MVQTRVPGGVPRFGHLGHREFGYALARYATMRNEPRPPWPVHLEPDLRGHLKRSLRYLADQP
ncbi:MAG: hypothetical protein ACRDTU_00440 [Micromonosporaceae bacterium]